MPSKSTHERAIWSARPFADQVEDLWAKAEQRRRANYATLHRHVRGLGYEAFRRMCIGETPPRPDVMEQVATVLGLDPREFPEYRLYQMQKACERYPVEIGEVCYDLVMQAAERLDEKAQQANVGKERAPEPKRGCELSGNVQ